LEQHLDRLHCTMESVIKLVVDDQFAKLNKYLSAIDKRLTIIELKINGLENSLETMKTSTTSREPIASATEPISPFEDRIRNGSLGC